MTAGLEGWLEVVRPHLSTQLVGAAALARALCAAPWFPCDGMGALEIRLGRECSGVVDLALHLTTATQARAVEPRVAPPHLRRFLSAWSDGQHPEVASVWLELDLDREPPVRPVPGVCAALGTPVLSSELTDRLLRSLRGRPLPPTQRRRLARCLAAIPAPGRLLYLASMESRRSDAVRLVVSGLGVPALIAFLRRIAPAAVAEAVAQETSLVVGAGDERTHLSFDVGGEVEGRVGIECSFPRLPRREPGWAALLEALTAAGLCTAEQRCALLAWPGYDSFWTAPGLWPQDSDLADTAGTFCIRCLSHLKLVCSPDGPPAAKAYLLFGSLRRRPSPPAGGVRIDRGLQAEGSDRL